MSIARLTLVLLCSTALGGCEGASEPEFKVPGTELNDLQEGSIQNGNSFLGAWKITSAVLGNDELLPGGQFSYVMTFWSETHSVAVSGDVDHLVCPAPATSCGWSGMYTFTGTSITTVEPNHPDPGEQGEDTAFYTFCSNKLIFMDEGDGDGLKLTFERTRRDCYVRDCS